MVGHIYNNKNEKIYRNPQWASHLCYTYPNEYSRTPFDLTEKKEEKSEVVEKTEVKPIRKTRKKKTTKED